MKDPHPSPSPEMRDAYRRGVAALLEGRLDDADRDLAGPADAGFPEAVLAVAKVHLEREEGAAARRRLAALLATPPADAGLHAYLLLLDAAGAALAGQADEAFRLLDEVSRKDARLAAAAGALRRRLEKGRAPLIRF